jgi:hypothetical protein
MSQKDDHIERGAEDSSRTLDAGKPLYELGSRILLLEPNAQKARCLCWKLYRRTATGP